MIVKASLLHVVALVMVVLVSCKKDDEEDVSNPVVINELMPSNTVTAADQDGEYDDWVEFYNTSDSSVNLSGCYLTDNSGKLTKWQFPSGTKIAGKGYLIIWADKDTTQDGLHANFKLSSEGEELLLVSAGEKIIDQVTYGSQTEELSYARNPNGTGSFVWQTPTFNAQN